MAFAPPLATALIVVRISVKPAIGPRVTPWSMGMITVFPEARSMILSIRIRFPTISSLLFFILVLAKMMDS
jgi:hypothetical protein